MYPLLDYSSESICEFTFYYNLTTFRLWRGIKRRKIRETGSSETISIRAEKLA